MFGGQASCLSASCLDMEGIQELSAYKLDPPSMYFRSPLLHATNYPVLVIGKSCVTFHIEYITRRYV